MKQQDQNKLKNHIKRLCKEIRLTEYNNLLSKIFNDQLKYPIFTGYKELTKIDIKELQMLSQADYWNREVNDYSLKRWFMFGVGDYLTNSMLFNEDRGKHWQQIQSPVKSFYEHKPFAITKLLCDPICIN